jgi:hypothetical protein
MTALAHAMALAACCIGIHLQPPAHARMFDPAPLAIGDSVLLGAAHQVARRGFEVDAREGRFMRNALKVLRHLRRDHRRPPVVLIAIGTNQPPSRAEIAGALRLLGRRQTLVFVTPRRSFAPLPVPAVWAAHRSHPHRIRVLDWAAFSAPFPQWFYADGTHLRPAGALGYARLLARALRWVGPDACACVGVIQGAPMMTSTSIGATRTSPATTTLEPSPTGWVPRLRSSGSPGPSQGTSAGASPGA